MGNSRMYQYYKDNLDKFEEDVINLYKEHNCNIFVKDMYKKLKLTNSDIKFLPSFQDILNKVDLEMGVVNYYTCSLDNSLLVNEIKRYCKVRPNGVLKHKLNHLCKKIHNKTLNDYAIFDLNIEWKELTNYIPKNYYSSYENLKKDIIKLKEEIGHFPSKKQISEHLGVGLKKFNGYASVRNEIEGELYLQDATNYLNRSEGELAIAQFLIKNNIEYKRDVIISQNPDIDGKYNCDFVIEDKEGKSYWIEFWGAYGMFNYEDKIKKKIEIYKKYKHRLISITFNDYYKNKYDDFINILTKKLSFIKNIKKVDKQEMFLSYKIMSDEELYKQCLDDNREKITIEQLDNSLSGEIYKRFNSYLDLFEKFENKIYNHSKFYLSYGIDNIFIDILDKKGRIISIKEINSLYIGLSKTIDKNKGKIYWEIKTYIKMTLLNKKIPEIEIKKLKNYIFKGKSSSGSKLNEDTLLLIKNNKNILMEVVNVGNSNTNS